MTHNIDTAPDRTFSDPPNVTVSGERTHCNACQAPLDPNVMHKCDGNKEYEPPPVSSKIVTAACLICKGEGVVLELMRPHGSMTYVVVCKECRAFVYPEVHEREIAISMWNAAELAQYPVPLPKWMAEIPGVDAEPQPSVVSLIAHVHPDLTGYSGVCPACKGESAKPVPEGEVGIPCDLCDSKGVIE